MKSLSWLFTIVLFAGCATKPAPMFEDVGVFPTANPYDHRQNPQYDGCHGRVSLALRGRPRIRAP